MPSTVELPETERAPGLILPSGEINWNCPCLGGMATGPCGVEFREAFSCFHYRCVTNETLTENDFANKYLFQVLCRILVRPSPKDPIAMINSARCKSASRGIQLFTIKPATTMTTTTMTLMMPRKMTTNRKMATYSAHWSPITMWTLLTRSMRPLRPVAVNRTTKPTHRRQRKHNKRNV